MPSTAASYQSIPTARPTTPRLDGEAQFLSDAFASVPPSRTPSRASSFTSATRLRTSASRRKVGHKEGTASIWSSYINLANTILGAGILAMPHALSSTGLALGCCAIVFAGCTSSLGLYLLSRCATRLEPGQASFFALAKRTYPSAAPIFDTAIAIKCFGVAVSYMIIIGDLMPQVIASLISTPSPFLLERGFWISASLLVIIPVSFLRRLDSLKYTSIVALFAVAYLVLTVVYHYIRGDTLEQRGPIKYWEWSGPRALLSALPVFVFANTCHQNIFSIINELALPTQRRVNTTIALSIGTSTSLYLLVGITGYLSYGDNVAGNIISMYSGGLGLTFGRLAIVVLFLFSYALQAHPCRASLDKVITSLRSPPSSVMESPRSARSMTVTTQMSDAMFSGLTAGIVICSYVVAMLVTSLERVLAYVGATGSTTISFILPGLFYWAISRKSGHALVKQDDPQSSSGSDTDSGEDEEEEDVVKKRKKNKKGVWMRRIALSLASYGVVVMGVCLCTLWAGVGSGGH
ncbi:hypothetical protein YB2330_006553 [Saitoella coloradoensis]